MVNAAIIAIIISSLKEGLGIARIPIILTSPYFTSLAAYISRFSSTLSLASSKQLNVADAAATVNVNAIANGYDDVPITE